MTEKDDKTRAELLGQMRDDELTPPERQQTRLTNHIVSRDMVSPEEIRRRSVQHDRLWGSLGWVPPLLENWKAWMAIIVIAVFIGGETLLTNVTSLIRGWLP